MVTPNSVVALPLQSIRVRQTEEPLMNDNKPSNVLFLCTGNSARSILAECIINRLGQGRFRAHSAGSQPKGEVHPDTIKLLERLGYSTEDLRSKSWDEFAGTDATPLDYVVTVCNNAANETCPVWPGHPISAHWDVPDPAAATGTERERRLAFLEAYRILLERISNFFDVPIDARDRSSLEKLLDEFGKTSSESA